MLAFLFTVRSVLPVIYNSNNTEHFSNKTGHAMWVVKLIKEDWPIVRISTLKMLITKVLEFKAFYTEALLCVP